MSSLDSIISIHGAPRSGTTWLAQMLALNPEAVFRYQPFFSYAFKNQITKNSSAAAIKDVLEKIYLSDDPFVCQQGKHRLGNELIGPSKRQANSMVMKSVRYHELIEPILNADQRVIVLAIVRHPCAVINSWLRTSREFNASWDVASQWNTADFKNNGNNSEYWGFQRWLDLTELFIKLEQKFPARVRIVQYEHLVNSLVSELSTISEWAPYTLTNDMLRAALKSQQTTDQVHNYDVYKSPSVAHRWQHELEVDIRNEIEKTVNNRADIMRRLHWN